MEIRCYRKILHISYKDHVTNEEVRAQIQQAHEDLLTIVRRRKLQWYGRVPPFIRSGENEHASRAREHVNRITLYVISTRHWRAGVL